MNIEASVKKELEGKFLMVLGGLSAAFFAGYLLGVFMGVTA